VGGNRIGVVSGEYYEPVGVLGTRTKKSKDLEMGKELWEWTQGQLKTGPSELLVR
jgi:retinol dehydrogenase-12